MTYPKPEFSLSPEEYDAITRLNFWIFVQRVFAELTPDTYIDNYHIQLLCSELGDIRAGMPRRICIALPPRSLKSIIISVALPAWLLGHNPAMVIICASYGQDLADKLAADCRQVMQSAWYRLLFPAARLMPGRQSVAHFETDRGGRRIATSVGGVLTGLGADIIIVDDPMKLDEAYSETERMKANNWAHHTLFTRLNDKRNGTIIIVMQRLHEDDMIGHVCSFADFELLSFPAIAQCDERHVIKTPFGTLHHHRREGEALHPSREPLEVLEQQRRLMGSAFFAAQYLQSPTPPGGGLIKTLWFNNRFDLENRPQFVRIVESWDTASKSSELSDFSVCTTWGVTANGDMYLINVFRQRIEYPDLKRKVRELAALYRATVILIEDTASGMQLIQELRYEGLAQIIAIRPQGDKVMRMQAQTAMMEAGVVRLPREVSWLPDYLHELEMFPKGKYDDQVDSTAQALAFISQTSSPMHWLRMMDEHHNRRDEFDEAGLTVTFDHPVMEIEFKVSTGRWVRRSVNGFYHVTEDEWQGLRCEKGVVRVDSDGRQEGA